MRKNSTVVVMGLGSEHGDDHFGWRVVSELHGCQTCIISDSLSIADVPPGCEKLILVDACRGAGLPGSVHRFGWPDNRFVEQRVTSSHGWGLTEGLLLAEALGRLPPRVVIFAVEAGGMEPGSGMSPEVAMSIPLVVDSIRKEIWTP